MIPPHIVEYLEMRGASWRARVHPRRFTAQEIAAAEHVKGRHFAKTIVLEHEGRLILGVLGADRDADLDRLARHLPGVRLADEDDFAGRFVDCEIGAMPPLGELYGMEVVLDAGIAKQPWILFNGGSHEDSIEMPFEAFRLLAPVRVIDFARPVGQPIRAKVA